MPKKKSYSTDEQARDALAHALSKTSDTYLKCRDMRHAWDVLEDFHIQKRAGSLAEIIRDLVCLRCGTIRKEKYVRGRYGLDKDRQKYDYPEDYQYRDLGVMRGVKPRALIQEEQFDRAQSRAAQRGRKQ